MKIRVVPGSHGWKRSTVVQSAGKRNVGRALENWAVYHQLHFLYQAGRALRGFESRRWWIDNTLRDIRMPIKLRLEARLRDQSQK